MNLSADQEHHKWRMMDYFMLKCKMCLQYFSEDRLPRNLPCSHSICSDCADQKAHKVCPECYTVQLIRSVDDHKVNFLLAQLIESECLKDIDTSDDPLPLFPKDIPSSGVKQAPSVCFGHGNPTSLFCSTCCTWICEDCVVIDHMILPRGKCRILGAADAMMNIRSEHRKLIDQNLKDIMDMEKWLEFQMVLHEFCLKHCCAKDTSHNEVISQVESHLKEVKEKNNLYSQYIKDRMKNSIDEASSTSSAEVVTTNYNEFLRFQDALREDMANADNKMQPAMKTILKHLKMDLLELLKGDKPLYAVYEVNKEIKRSQIILKENRLLLQCLIQGKSPRAGIKIPFEYVRKLIPEVDALIWFEVGTKKKARGEVILRLKGTSHCANQAILMNTGEKGHSYKNTCFRVCEWEENIIEGGDYENNDGSGRCLLVKCDNNDCRYVEDRMCQPVAGDVFGDIFGSTKFKISLENKDSISYGFNFGRVIQGLDILKTAAKQKPVSKLVIRDCGIFIST